MRLQKYVVTATFFLLLAGSASAVLTGNESPAQAVRQAVETYCKLEFEGGWMEDRWEVTKFSNKRKAERKIGGPADASVFTLQNHYPFIVIASYDIREVRVLSPTHATAQVAYRRLAYSESATGREWHLIAEPAHDETVTLNLVFDKKKWWVLDPPAPRISKQRLLEHYEYRVKRNSSRWEQELNDPTYDEEQKANVRATRDQATGTVRILKDLP